MKTITKIILIFIGGVTIGGPITIFFASYSFNFQPDIYSSFALTKKPSDWRTFDNNGIYLTDYGGNLGKQYNPVSISQYALINYNYYINMGELRYKNDFLKHADWLVKNQVITSQGFGIWQYNFDFKGNNYNCKKPWISAMAQGQAMSVLTRAYQLTQEEKYLKTAEKALGSFAVLDKDGGVRYIDNDGSVFYLEYACDTEPPARVLNGFIFSLLGLHDYYLTTGNRKALNFFEEGLSTLKTRLLDYDTGKWTTYDLLGTKASEDYHRLHSKLLYELYFITGDQFFLKTAEKWYGYK